MSKAPNSQALDLENLQDLNRISEPQLYLERHREKRIFIDEVQRKPDLFSLLRVLSDQGGYHFLLLGSSSPKLMRQSSESLAGRIEYLECPPLTLEETEMMAENRDSLWLRGGYPKS